MKFEYAWVQVTRYKGPRYNESHDITNALTGTANSARYGSVARYNE
jgi:hypothetical protein